VWATRSPTLPSSVGLLSKSRPHQRGIHPQEAQGSNGGLPPSATHIPDVDVHLERYFALCENEPVARVRFNCLQAMIQPCGKPPLKDDDMED
ncbi:unnamed protein product, partial [Polarella glacialis]